ncbi:MAG: hypothetical protein ACPGQS_06990 [Bradymonadia bacterium]
MKRVNWVILPLIIACGVGEVERDGSAINESTNDTVAESTSKAITLQPEIRPEGIDDLYSRLSVTDLKFFGALHLIPAEESALLGGQSSAFKFSFSDGVAQTTTVGRSLSVFGPGRYHVLMTIHPFEGAPSVDVAGSVLEHSTDMGETGRCRDEAAPTTADNGVSEAAPTTADEENMEAAPTTADEENMEAAPTTADEENMEAAPTTADDDNMEAAPTTADEDNMEAGPITADEGAMEAAPITADGETSDRTRGERHDLCLWETRYTEDSKFKSSSTDSYEFDLGTVVIGPADTHLILTWDMSDWMGLVLGEDLGLSFVELVALHNALSAMTETDDQEESFTPDRVRLETN